MHWTTKAALQRWIAALPDPLSLALYYRLQRQFGGLKNTDPMIDIAYGHALVQRVERARRSVTGARILEVGTGRRLNLPIAWWLCGAQSIATVDLHPYLKMELVLEDIARLQRSAENLRAVLGKDLVEERLQRLLGASLQQTSAAHWLDFFSITYVSPADAAAVPLETGSIDLHVSNNVLEHIPGDVIVAILAEGRRLLSPSGIFAHRVDFSDHFAREGSGISSVNFLTYAQREWDRIAGNRFMYMNRLRVDDMDKIFAAGDVAIESRESVVDDAAAALIRTGKLSVDAAFKAKPVEVLATREAWYVGASAQRVVLPGDGRKTA